MKGTRWKKVFRECAVNIYRELGVTFSGKA